MGALTIGDVIGHLRESLDEIAKPHLIGVTGAVAVGKTTFARALAHHLREQGARVEVLGTDAFLLPNVVLAERGLTFRKGFPETFDVTALRDALRALRSGEWEVVVPVYSHDVYDIITDARTTLRRADVVVIEGVNALQDPAREYLDTGIYLHAPEVLVRGWYVERFLDLCREALAEPGSFYAGFASMSEDDQRAVAEAAWDGVNGPNLHRHIEPTRVAATLVVEKGPGHVLTALWP